MSQKNEADANLKLATEIGKAISDLDTLVQSLIKSLPSAKPWQRQLLARLANIEREVQVLRMTIALDRDLSELSAAAIQLHTSLAAACIESNKGRADQTTKAGIRLVLGLSKRVRDSLTRQVLSQG